jgi:hypothetical protein
MHIDMVDELDAITYHLLAGASDDVEARRVGIVAYWARQQAERLAAGQSLRLDHASVVAEALAGTDCSRPPVRPTART